MSEIKSNNDRLTEAIREEELQFFLNRAEPKSRVLEIGAGSGYQASRIAAIGHTVDAVDIRIWSDPAHPVTLYDGANLPFADKTFDYVFSSNALEHVIPFDALEAEIGRVLKDDGLAIHVLPTHTWRLWTTLTYYPALPKIVRDALQHLQREKDGTHAPAESSAPESDATPAPRGLARYFKWIGTLCMSPRHGERGNRVTEYFYFRPSWWLDHFRRRNFEIIDHRKTGIYYSGNYLLGLRLGLKARRHLARLLGSSTVCYIMRPKRAAR